MSGRLAASPACDTPESNPTDSGGGGMLRWQDNPENATKALARALDVGSLHDLPHKVRECLKYRADPDGRLGHQAFLTVAARRGCLESVEALLRAGAQPNPPGGISPLQWATTHPDPAMVRVLLAHGAIPIPSTDDGETSGVQRLLRQNPWSPAHG